MRWIGRILVGLLLALSAVPLAQAQPGPITAEYEDPTFWGGTREPTPDEIVLAAILGPDKRLPTAPSDCERIAQGRLDVYEACAGYLGGIGGGGR